jgi:uncharacterized protein YjbI with pentapeptide repeats
VKNSVFTSHVLSNDAISSLEEIARADCTFSKLTTVAGLNPEQDFRFADLRELDFSYSDLRGYDFTGADLTGVVGAHAIVDQTTIFADAIVEDSIFSSRIRLENYLQRMTAQERCSTKCRGRIGPARYCGRAKTFYRIRQIWI